MGLNPQGSKISWELANNLGYGALPPDRFTDTIRIFSSWDPASGFVCLNKHFYFSEKKIFLK